MTSGNKPLGVKGVPGHGVSQSHPDVTGNFGGYKTWMVHYRPKTRPLVDAGDRVEVYYHIGSFHDAGKWAGQKVSRIDIVRRLSDMFEEGMSAVGILHLIILMLRYAWERR